MSIRPRWVSLAPSTDRPITFPVLDTLRFVGALCVVITHVAFQTGQYDAGLLGAIAARFDIGVALFFALSGFLLARPFLARIADGRPAPSVRFYTRKRLLRVVPVYLVSAFLVLSLMAPSRGRFWPHWVENLTLTSIYTPNDLPQGLTQMWSLATEVAFYTLLPLLMAVVARTACRNTWRPAPIFGLIALLGAANVAWLSVVQLDSDLNLWLPAYLSWFGVGLALAVISVDLDRDKPHRWSHSMARIGQVPVACIVAAAALLVIAATPLAGPTVGDVPTAPEAISKNLLYASFAFLIVGTGVFGTNDSLLLRGLTWSPLRYLGRISYGLFCIHLLVLYGVFQWRDISYFEGHFAEVLVLTLIGSFFAAAALHAWIEVPFSRLRGSGRPAPEETTTPSANAITT